MLKDKIVQENDLMIKNHLRRMRNKKIRTNSKIEMKEMKEKL